jgi:hypothetical protein
MPPDYGRHVRHHLAKFVRLVTRAAQNRRHHLVRQKVVERCPVAVAFDAPMLMGDGEPPGVKFDIGFRGNPRSFNPLLADS